MTALVDVRAGVLQDALAELARENHADILYSTDLVRGRRTQAIKGRLSTEQAVALLLKGSGVGYRLTSDNVLVLFELPRREIADPGDGAISEVLVLGRRSQNADIRRTENDIQPYTVAGPRELAVAAQDTIDQYLRERLPANGRVFSPGQLVNNTGAPNSAIDLRGVGLQRTLVLVDGRRLPSLPTQMTGLEQSDVNAIPLGAIERIETLTATAGGIHGPTAIGGAVNLVLKRDYRGADLTVVSGLSSRGDAGHARIEARLGFTPDQGRTDVMLSASYSAAERLTVGQRDYARRSLELQARNNPAEFLLQTRAVNAITVRSISGEPLRLDAALGGTVLNGSYTFLPITFQGTAEEKAAVLVANAGRLPTEPAAGLAGDDTSLTATPTTYSILFSARRRLGDRLEAFVDGFDLHQDSTVYTPQSLSFRSTSADNASGNLFANAVGFYFPLPGLVEEKRTTTDVRRLTGGLIATLPRGWQASADYTLGRALLDYRRQGLITTSGLDNALRDGSTGALGQMPVIPLGDFAALQAAAMAYVVPTATYSRLTTQFSSGVARAAGPLVTLPGGPVTATLLAEVRRERMPETETVLVSQAGTIRTPSPDRVQRVTSGYVELRAPVLARDSRIAPARGLELQLALRRDEVKTTFPDITRTGVATLRVVTAVRHQADVFTLGLRTFPADWLMLRASAATGQSPPDMTHLQEMLLVATSPSAFPYTDPKRGGRLLVADGAFLWGRSGWHDIGQEKGLTRSVGVVFNPSGRSGPRLSIDASRVEIRDEIGLSGLNAQQVINAEERYPNRVIREPLSAADAALGYTAGRVIGLYTGLGNVGRTVAETVDVRLDWTLPTILDGDTQLYGAGVWQPTLRTRRRPDTPWLDRVGYRDGPLQWRGNAGVQWERGPLLLDLNVQYLGRSSPLWSAYSMIIQTTSRNQGRTYIPSRAYLDLTARRRFDFGSDHALRSFDVRLALQNVLDTSPPIIADPNHMGYDYRGDPRRRRFEFKLTGHF